MSEENETPRAHSVGGDMKRFGVLLKQLNYGEMAQKLED